MTTTAAWSSTAPSQHWLSVLAVALGALLAAACARPAAPPPPAAARVAPSDADDDLRETVMRELITTFGSMEWSRAPGEEAVRVDVLCVGFGEQVDPGIAFMARLADEHRVVQASRCRYDDDGGGVRALPSGLPAMFLYVEDVRRTGDRAEARGSYFHDGKGAAEDRFVLRRVSGRWVVESRTRLSIS